MGHRGMTAALVTMAAGDFSKFLPLVIPTFSAFAEKHGYTVHVETEIRDAQRPAAWTKIIALREALDRFDEVLWVDSDAIILDSGEDIRSAVAPTTDFAWVVHRFSGSANPNSGVMLLRRSPQILELLDAVYEQEDLIEHGWWENGALMRLLGYEHSMLPRPERPLELPRISVEHLPISWNSLRQDYSTSPRIRHFAGDPVSVRLTSMCELVLSHPGIVPEATGEQHKRDAQRILGDELADREAQQIAQVKAAAEAAEVRERLTFVSGKLEQAEADATEARMQGAALSERADEVEAKATYFERRSTMLERALEHAEWVVAHTRRVDAEAMEAVLTSRSWRATSPIRTLARRFRGEGSNAQKDELPALLHVEPRLPEFGGPAPLETPTIASDPVDDAPIDPHTVTRTREILGERLADQLNRRVAYGPFSGLEIGPDYSWGRGSDLGAMLLGIYEWEVVDVLTSIPATHVSMINLGAGEGFYPLGWLRGGDDRQAYCFEALEPGRQVIHDNAARNGLSERVKVFGSADRDFLTTIGDPDLDPSRTIVVCDIEGGEFEVFDDGVFEALEGAWLVIELHEWVDETGVKVARLLEGAAPWFTPRFLRTSSRDPGAFKELRSWTDDERWAICSEGRPELMRWVVLEPKSRSGDLAQ